MKVTYIKGFFLSMMGVVALLGYTASSLGVESFVPLQFENLFPDSEYKGVHKACVQMWHDLRQIQTRGSMDAEQLQNFNMAIIDKLIHLHGRVAQMLQEPRACAPDDLEFLVELLQHMSIEYNTMMHRPIDRQEICIIVLFEHIKRKLVQPLE